MRTFAWCTVLSVVGVVAGCEPASDDLQNSEPNADDRVRPALQATSAAEGDLGGEAPTAPEGDLLTAQSVVESQGESSPASSALCDLPEQDFSRATSSAEFSQRLIGNWTLCGQVSVFGTSQQGLAIRADGTWQRLYLEQGLLVPRDADPSGRWEVIDTTEWNGPGSYQLNLEGATGTVITHPAFAGSPRKMRLNNNGAFVADYVIDQGAPPPPPTPIRYALSYPAQACSTAAAGKTHFADMESAEEALVGRWLGCGGSPFGTDEIGLELDADGRWYKLDLASDGLVERAQGFGREGRWSLRDTGAMNGSGVFQVNLEVDGGGTIFSVLSATGSPRRLHVNNNGVFAADYAIDP